MASFILPEDCWVEHYYEPQVAVADAFLEKHAGNTAAAEFVKNEQREAELYRKCKDYYGYAFYIGKKR